MLERSLVSFVLLAYNQEKYIREAIEGAFSQTYSPLEIILSDDGSKDRTFEIMQEMAAAYGGPHQVVLNRNEKNLGIGGHVKKVGELAKGEWIVMAAGDDVSMAHRTETLMKTASADNCCAAVFSDCSVIDDDGKPLFDKRHWNQRDPITLRKVITRGGGIGAGATYAYRRNLWSWPYPYDEKLMNEDRVLPLRAALFGKITFTDKCLVKWRRSATSVSHTTDLDLLLAIGKEAHVSALIKDIRFAAQNGILSKWRAKDSIFCLKLLHFNKQLRRKNPPRIIKWATTLFVTLVVYREDAPGLLMHQLTELLRGVTREPPRL